MTAEEAKRAILEGLGGRGDKFRCPIPTHGRGRGDVNPSASVDVSPSGKLLVACPCCEQSALLDELKARGFWTSTGSRAGWTLTKTWKWWGPDGCRDAEEYDTPDGRERRWKGKDGIKPKRLVYPVRGNHDRPGRTYVGPILFVEGAKTAEAAFKLTGLPAFGFASSTAKKNGAAGQLPDDDVLLWAGVECGAEFRIVPDNDPPGRKAGAILARRLQQLRPGIPVRWVDPSKLVKAPANGWDLADWIDPPADAAERIRAALGEPPAPPKAATAPPAPPTGTPPASGEVVESEHHLAELFARERGGQWRCQIERDLWLEWRGAGWEPAFPGHILDVLGLFGRERLQRISKGEVVPDPRRGGKLSTVTASAKYARAMKPIATRADDWDATPDLIGLPGNRLLEVVDGKLVEREGTREDLVSKALSARPAAPSEWRGGLWAQHLEGLFDDPAMAAFLQSLCGYSVLGRGTEHKLVLCPGRGGTGKTVTFSAIAAAAGDYGEICNPAAITSTRGMPTHPVARTAFIGRRVVVSPELDSGAVLDCAFTKRLSGGDVCTARGMRENETKFVYRGLLFIHTNAEPQLLSPDSGLKRRLVVLPFARIREHPDVDFLSKIDPSHVAAWLVEGAAHYLAYGLMAAPPAVVAASRAFHEYADPFSSFVDRWLTLSSTAAVPVQDVYERYQQHCRESGQLKPATSRTLLKRLREGGFGLSTDRKTMGVQWLDGASLLDDREAA